VDNIQTEKNIKNSLDEVYMAVNAKLAEAEADIKKSWQDILKQTRKDLAYVWSDEVKEDLTRIKDEAKKIDYVFRKCHNGNKIHPDVERLLEHIKSKQANRTWIKELYSDLRVLIDDVESSQRDIHMNEGIGILRKSGFPVDKYPEAARILAQDPSAINELDEDLVRALEWASAEAKYMEILKERLKTVDWETENFAEVNTIRKGLTILSYIGEANQRLEGFASRTNKELQIIFHRLSVHAGEKYSSFVTLLTELRRIIQELRMEHQKLFLYLDYYNKQLGDELDKDDALAALQRKIEDETPLSETASKINEELKGFAEKVLSEIEEPDQWVIRMYLSLKKARELLISLTEERTDVLREDGMRILKRRKFPVDKYSAVAEVLAVHPSEIEELGRKSGFYISLGFPAFRTVLTRESFHEVVSVMLLIPNGSQSDFNKADIVTPETFPDMAKFLQTQENIAAPQSFFGKELPKIKTILKSKPWMWNKIVEIVSNTHHEWVVDQLLDLLEALTPSNADVFCGELAELSSSTAQQDLYNRYITPEINKLQKDANGWKEYCDIIKKLNRLTSLNSEQFRRVSEVVSWKILREILKELPEGQEGTTILIALDKLSKLYKEDELLSAVRKIIKKRFDNDNLATLLHLIIPELLQVHLDKELGGEEFINFAIQLTELPAEKRYSTLGILPTFLHYRYAQKIGMENLGSYVGDLVSHAKIETSMDFKYVVITLVKPFFKLLGPVAFKQFVLELMEKCGKPPLGAELAILLQKNRFLEGLGFKKFKEYVFQLENPSITQNLSLMRYLIDETSKVNLFKRVGYEKMMGFLINVREKFADPDLFGLFKLIEEIGMHLDTIDDVRNILLGPDKDLNPVYILTIQKIHHFLKDKRTILEVFDIIKPILKLHHFYLSFLEEVDSVDSLKEAVEIIMKRKKDPRYKSVQGLRGLGFQVCHVTNAYAGGVAGLEDDRRKPFNNIAFGILVNIKRDMLIPTIAKLKELYIELDPQKIKEISKVSSPSASIIGPDMEQSVVLKKSNGITGSVGLIFDYGTITEFYPHDINSHDIEVAGKQVRTGQGAKTSKDGGFTTIDSETLGVDPSLVGQYQLEGKYNEVIICDWTAGGIFYTIGVQDEVIDRLRAISKLLSDKEYVNGQCEHAPMKTGLSRFVQKKFSVFELNTETNQMKEIFRP